MEIGSFIELQMPQKQEYHHESRYPGMQIARLNSGRAAIWHAFRLTEASAVWIPYYQCETVRDFLKKKNVKIKYYHIDNKFDPTDIDQKSDEAVLLVNYYGIMSHERMKKLSLNYTNVIIDNSQSFFCAPVENCQNVYSCRKFIGVPDGAYVIGKNAAYLTDEYEQGYSSDTSLFLFQRIEYGCEGKTYSSREINESRIDGEDIKRMSKLTEYILKSADYENIIKKRVENFETAKRLFSYVNKLDPDLHRDASCVPMVYPLLIEDDSVLPTLLESKHFQGHWWKYVTEELEEKYFEHYVSRYMVPITIDQRYDGEAVGSIFNVLKNAGLIK